jgi:ABC-type glycerol-3-phosphate transport system substrate-binding protein
MTDGNKYRRAICNEAGGIAVDVYDVLVAFAVTCPARQHAVKKLLMAGLRGGKDAQQDLEEAGQAVARALELERVRVWAAKQTPGA